MIVGGFSITPEGKKGWRIYDRRSGNQIGVVLELSADDFRIQGISRRFHTKYGAIEHLTIENNNAREISLSMERGE